VTIIVVDSTVVATESEYELSSTGMAILFGIKCGVTSKPNCVIPRAEGVYQPICSQEASHTYKCKIKDQRCNRCHPTPVAYDPAPPDLQVKSN
jgi:hypothetical protein